MVKEQKKSPFKHRVQKVKAKFLATYYSNPAKDIKIIAVAGTVGREITAHYLHNIIKVLDEKAGLILEPTSTSDLYKQLFAHWKDGANYAVISLPSEALANHFCYGLPIHIAVLTDNPEDQGSAITNVSTDEQQAKSILFNTQPNFSIICRDSSNYDVFSHFPTHTATFSYGRDREADLRINRSKLYKVGAEANFTYGQDNFDVATYVTSESAVYYMAAATAAAFALDITIENIIDGIADYEPSIPENTQPTNQQN